MRGLALLSLTLPAQDPAALRGWWAEQLELPVDEQDEGALALGDLSVRFGPRLELRIVSFDVEIDTTLTAPDGTTVVVAPPDHEAAARNEESIRSFVEGAADLPGRSVDEAADDVAAVVLAAQQQIRGLVEDLPNDKRLAVYLELGQRARGSAPGQDWHLHAASTLMSDTFGPGT